MLYEANRSGLLERTLVGSFAHAISSEIVFERAASALRMASMRARAGSGPIDADVDQQAVVVGGESCENAYTASSCGRKCTLPFAAARTVIRSLGRENFAAITFGACGTSASQNAGSLKLKRNARAFA